MDLDLDSHYNRLMSSRRTLDSESESPEFSRTRSIVSAKSSSSAAPTSFGNLSTFFNRQLRRRRNSNDSSVEERIRKEVKARNRSETAFQQMFEALDQNKDRMIDMRELKRLMDGLGMRAKQRDIQRLFQRVDRDGDGKITFEDFRLDWIDRWQNIDDKKTLLWGLFKMLDVTGDGVIEHKEVKMVMMSVGEKVSNQEIEEMFRIFDKNASGGIDHSEFSEAMMTHINKIMPKESDLLRIKAEGQRRLARVQAIKEGQRLLELPPYVAGSEDTETIRITTV